MPPEFQFEFFACDFRNNKITTWRWQISWGTI